VCAFVGLSLSSPGQNPTNSAGLSSGEKLNPKYSKAAAIQAIMDRYTQKDLPGIAIAVYTEAEGWWSGASGFSKTETKKTMTIENLQYLQSVSKTYMAVAALKLAEEGKLDLDAPISKYLPKKYVELLKNADKIKVRMLMNHTSGIPEYTSDPEYTATVILNPTKILKLEDEMNCLKNEEPQFEPGAKYRYTNTNYYLLTVIGDVITGDHAKYIGKMIFQPLSLNNTFYHHSKGYLEYPLLPDSYWDILNSGRPANITKMQIANVASMSGDDGIVATPIDAVKFLKGLMEGKLIKESSMSQMQQWVKNESGRPVYGLGLIRFEEGGTIGFGHGGGGLGAGCLLLTVPAARMYVFLATNIGVVIDGPVGTKVNSMKDEILLTLLQ
jgi:D-alanyl-D-alanine carboxypeptidase